MSTFVKQTVATIEERLAALNEEMERLVAARAALKPGDGTPARPAPARSARARALSAKQQQALALIAENPGINAAELSRRLESKGYGYQVIATFRNAGQIERCEGGGWQVKAGKR